MSFVRFKQHDGTDAWVNPELVAYVRAKLDGEAGTMIMCEGSGVFVQETPAEVVAALEDFKINESILMPGALATE